MKSKIDVQLWWHNFLRKKPHKIKQVLLTPITTSDWFCSSEFDWDVLKYSGTLHVQYICGCGKIFTFNLVSSDYSYQTSEQAEAYIRTCGRLFIEASKTKPVFSKTTFHWEDSIDI